MYHLLIERVSIVTSGFVQCRARVRVEFSWAGVERAVGRTDLFTSLDEGIFTSFMNLLIWNVSGLNHPSKQNEVLSILRANKISFACLIETRVQEHKVVSIFSSMLPDWECCFNYGKHALGRIWLCWNKAVVRISVLDKSDQCINCLVHYIKDNTDWFQSFVYGANKPVDRRYL
jgi:hypothetical protein